MLILTLEGFSPAALSCYGSSWNRTPAIDHLAGRGETFNRAITPVVDPLVQWDRWANLLAERIGSTSIVVITDDERLLDRPSAAAFEEMVLIENEAPHSDPDESDDASIPIETTMLGRLTAVAADRISRGESVWIHSRFLTRCWDAPRELGDAEEVDDEMQVNDDLEDEKEYETDEERVPWIIDSQVPPDVTLHSGDDPDWITTWMRTYGCQIRLLDAMVEILSSLESSTIIVGGTSGFALGQNGGIGHRTGPWRSCHLHVPMICSGGSGVRSRDVLSADDFAKIVHQRIESSSSPLLPSHGFALESGEAGHDTDPHCVATHDDDIPIAITTNEWFYVYAPDVSFEDQDLQTENDDGRLFLKPDDINDFNNVIRLRLDDADRLRDRLLLNQTSEQ